MLPETDRKGGAREALVIAQQEPSFEHVQYFARDPSQLERVQFAKAVESKLVQFAAAGDVPNDAVRGNGEEASIEPDRLARRRNRPAQVVKPVETGWSAEPEARLLLELARSCD